MLNTDNITIIGCGTIGAQASLYFMCKGFNVNVIVKESQFEKYHNRIDVLKDYPFWNRLLNRVKDKKQLTFTNDYQSITKSQLILECVDEDYSVKNSVFQKVIKHLSENQIIASSTSSLSINKMAATSGIKELIGLHFFSPIVNMKLVEIIKSKNYSSKKIDWIIDFTNRIDKTNVVLDDTPGFLINKLMTPFWIDCINEFEATNLSVEEYDKTVKTGCNIPIGPLALVDLVGVDVFVKITEQLFKETKSLKFKTPNVLIEKLKLGHLGRKTKHGFYTY